MCGDVPLAVVQYRAWCDAELERYCALRIFAGAARHSQEGTRVVRVTKYCLALTLVSCVFTSVVGRA